MSKVENSHLMGNNSRPAPRHIAGLSLKLAADTRTFFGSITNCIITIRELWSPRRQKNKLLVVLIPTLWNREEQLWSACLIRSPHTRYSSMMLISRFSWRARRLEWTSRTRKTASPTWARARACSVLSVYPLAEAGSLSSTTM